jgi:hypothetical protein
MKHCPKCNQEKDISEFYSEWAYQCKECKRKMDKEYRENPKNKERANMLKRERYLRSKLKENYGRYY